MNLKGHNSTHRGWRIFISERLGDVAGVAGKTVDGVVHRTRTFDFDCIDADCPIDEGAEAVYHMVKDDIDRIERELKEEREAPLRKLIKKKK